LKPKPIIQIEKIDFGEYEQEVKRIWDGEPPTSYIENLGKQGVRRYYNAGTMKSRYYRIQKLVGYSSNLAGHCSKCNKLNSHIMKEQVDGAIIITRYCTDHLPEEHKEQMPT
jgi:hypothetical protein